MLFYVFFSGKNEYFIKTTLLRENKLSRAVCKDVPNDDVKMSLVIVIPKE